MEKIIKDNTVYRLNTTNFDNFMRIKLIPIMINMNSDEFLGYDVRSM